MIFRRALWQNKIMNNLFHLAFPVKNLEESRRFYGEILGCEEGRSSEAWIDFNLFGHQIVAHLAPGGVGIQHRNEVDADHVPVPHFGIVLPMDEFKSFAERLKAKQIEFIIEPKIRFAGEVGEQATMFFLDPSGNALEFKAFADFSQVFAK
jgi:extradiol dioxygenase family protein